MPRSLLAGTSVVIVLYVLINAVFLATTPADELKGQLQVALIAGKHIFGENGGRFAGGVICLGLVAAISSMMWIGPRVTMSMGEDHWLLRLLGRKNKHGIPTNAVLLQLLMVNLLLLTQKLWRRGALHSIQSVALLVAGRVRGDGASFYASRTHAALLRLDLPRSTNCIFADHDLDDVLSLAFTYGRIPGWFGHGASGPAALLLHRKTPRSLAMKTRCTALSVILGLLTAATMVCAQENPGICAARNPCKFRTK